MSDPRYGSEKETMNPNFASRVLRTATEFVVVRVCAVAFGVTMQLFFISLAKSGTVGTRDFSVYWVTGRQLAKHANPYDATELLRTELALGFPPGLGVKFMRNPPWTLPLTLPFGLMSVRAASIAWSLLLLGCLAISVRLLWVMHGRPKNHRDWLGYAFAPGLLCLILGQTSIFALLGLVLFLYLRRRWPFWAGCSLWLCTMKPHLFLPFGLVLLLWVGVAKNYRILMGAATAILASIAFMEMIDPQAWGEYAAMVRTSGIEVEIIPCLSFYLRTWTRPGALWVQYVPAAVGCVWGVGYFWPRRRVWDWELHGGAVMLVSLLVAPYGWLFDQVLAIPALMDAAYRGASRDAMLVLAFASALIEGALFAGGRTPSAVYLWTLWSAPFWLVWYWWAQTVQRKRSEVGAGDAASG
jgi:hypothetical protein